MYLAGAWVDAITLLNHFDLFVFYDVLKKSWKIWQHQESDGLKTKDQIVSLLALETTLNSMRTYTGKELEI